MSKFIYLADIASITREQARKEKNKLYSFFLQIFSAKQAMKLVFVQQHTRSSAAAATIIIAILPHHNNLIMHFSASVLLYSFPICQKINLTRVYYYQ